MTLDEIFQKATVQSELVQTSRIDVNINRSERDRVGTLNKPRANLSADGSYHVTKPDRTKWDDSWDAGVHSELRQPLYDGGVTEASIKVADANIKASEWDVKDQEINLYLQIADLFYTIVGQTKDLQNLQETIGLYNERIKDLQQRERIGRSRTAEVFAAQTELELTKTQIVTAQNNIHAAQEQLSWLAGMAPPLDIDDQLSLEAIRPKVSAVRATDKFMLPSVEAANARIEAAKFNIDLTRSALNPKLDAIAAHDWRYLDASQQGSHDLSIGLGLTWVLYDAGEINAAVNTAAFEKSRAEALKQLASRNGDLNLNLAKKRLEDGLNEIKTYQKALDVVEKTYASQKKEYDSGLIINLDLLVTVDQRLQVRRNLDLAINRTKLAYLQAKVYQDGISFKH